MSENSTATVLPIITDQREWSPTGKLDAYFTDPQNLNLSNDGVNLVLALTTLAAILFLADTFARVIVRAHHSRVSARALLRANALAGAANPLSWPFALCDLVFRNSANDLSFDDASSIRTKTAVVPGVLRLTLRLRTKVLIVVAGVVLLSTELLFIFLSTATSDTVPFDRHMFPALKFESPTDNFAYVAPIRNRYHCTPWPVTRRRGFLTLYPINMCTEEWISPAGKPLFEGDAAPTERGSVWMELFAFDYLTEVRIVDQSVEIVLHHEMRVVHNSGNFYRVKLNATDVEMEQAGRDVLALRGIPIERFASSEDKEDPVQPHIRVRFELSTTGLRLSEVDLARGRDLSRELRLDENKFPPESMAWLVYIADAARSTMPLNGRQTAVHDDGGDNTLSSELDTDPEYVSLQRPRLSAVGSLFLLGGVMCVWALFALYIGWQGQTDHRHAWVQVFEGMNSPNDLRDLPPQSVSV